jgi:ATP-dependent Clp protease protease subunit
MKKLFQLLKANAKHEQRTSLSAKAEGEDFTMYMYDVIDADWGISALEVAKALAGVSPKATLNIRLNSPGGDVFEARAIATALKAHEGKVVAHIDGLAASAATTIAAAADEVIIADGSFYMIHNAWTLAMGDKNDFVETAALLEKVDGAINADYVKRTGMESKAIAKMMDAETWMTAQEAVDMKFADRIAPEGKTKNIADKKWNLAAFDHVPEALTKAPEPDVQDYAEQRARNERRLRLLSIE